MIADFPWYPLYVDDFEDGTSEMSLEEVGAYVRLMNHQWRRGSIPADPKSIGRVIGLSSPKRVRELWAKLGPKFEAVPGDPSRLVNQRLLEEKANSLTRSEVRSSAGKKGAERKHAAGNSSGNCQTFASPETENVLANGKQLPDTLYKETSTDRSFSFSSADAHGSSATQGDEKASLNAQHAAGNSPGSSSGNSPGSSSGNSPGSSSGSSSGNSQPVASHDSPNRLANVWQLPGVDPGKTGTYGGFAQISRATDSEPGITAVVRGDDELSRTQDRESEVRATERDDRALSSAENSEPAISATARIEKSLRVLMSDAWLSATGVSMGDDSLTLHKGATQIRETAQARGKDPHILMAQVFAAWPKYIAFLEQAKREGRYNRNTPPLIAAPLFGIGRYERAYLGAVIDFIEGKVPVLDAPAARHPSAARGVAQPSPRPTETKRVEIGRTR